MKSLYIKEIARKLGVKDWQVENCVGLFEEGATIPFISRYRKEKTGGLDDAAVAEVKHWNEVFSEMEKRKAGILATIEPMVATVFGIVVFSEPLTVLSGLGIILILSAVILLNWKA